MPAPTQPPKSPPPARFPIPAYLLLTLPNISAHAAKLYLLLAAISSHDGLLTARAADVAPRAGLSVRHFWRCIAELQAAGLLVRLPRIGRSTPNRILLTSHAVLNPPRPKPSELTAAETLRLAQQVFKTVLPNPSPRPAAKTAVTSVAPIASAAQSAPPVVPSPSPHIPLSSVPVQAQQTPAAQPPQLPHATKYFHFANDFCAGLSNRR